MIFHAHMNEIHSLSKKFIKKNVYRIVIYAIFKIFFFLSILYK